MNIKLLYFIREEFVLFLLFLILPTMFYSQVVGDKVIKVYDNTIEFEYYDGYMLPDSLFKHQQIEIVFFIGGETSSPDKLFNSLAGFCHLKKLYFQNFNLQAIPGNIEKLEKLETLRIIDDSLYKVSHKIKHSGIRSLIIQNAKIGSLPYNKQKRLFKRISRVKSLQYLDLDDNELDTLFNSISNANLQHLSISNNQFHRLPAIIVGMMANKALSQIELDFTDDLLFPKTELDKVVRRKRVYYEIDLFFDKEVTNNYMHDIINKMSQRYPCIDSFGEFRK